MLKTKATEAFWTSFRNQVNEASEKNLSESASMKFCNGLPDSTSPSTWNSWALQRRRTWSRWEMVQKFSSDWIVQAERHVRSKGNHHVMPSLLILLDWRASSRCLNNPPNHRFSYELNLAVIFHSRHWLQNHHKEMMVKCLLVIENIHY